MIEQGRVETAGGPESGADKGVRLAAAFAGASAARRARWLGLAAAVLAVAFAKPLYDLVRLSLGNSLYSHLPLIPVISLYFAWTARPELRGDFRPSPRLALFPLAAGCGLLGVYWGAGSLGWRLGLTDGLALTTLAFLMFFFSAFLALMGGAMLKALAFPAGFLFLLVPFPQAVENGIETFFQLTSAEAAFVMLKLSGIPVYREGLVFALPGITMEVAPQCSGIRSSLVLFITALVAGRMFFRNNWNRFILAFVVIPLGILRNGFRILVLGLLCYHISPDMIHSIIHRRGGPLFFVLSLVPFFLILLWLWRRERRQQKAEFEFNNPEEVVTDHGRLP